MPAAVECEGDLGTVRRPSRIERVANRERPPFGSIDVRQQEPIGAEELRVGHDPTAIRRGLG